MKVRHFGNTANNAFHNVQLLQRYAGIESELPFRMFGVEHAISAPAWDGVDFEVPDAAWVQDPDWSISPEAVEINRRYSDLPEPAERSIATDDDVATTAPHPSLSSRVDALLGARGRQAKLDLYYRQMLARRPTLDEPDDVVNVIYGSSSQFEMRIPSSARRVVCLEHGTVRWIGEGGRETRELQRAYRQQLKQAAIVWVTNLDLRTIELAEDVIPGRWAALPHPFMPDARVPFAGRAAHRRSLLEQTDSERLILLPASQNWSPEHDKGSIKALNAFIALRRAGHAVGLVAAEWGLQVEESKRLFADAGVAQHVHWVAPMGRWALQRMMADVDVVWDQFGIDVFGALALRTLEQGTPLVSRGLTESGWRLMGEQVPWRRAATADEIVQATATVFTEMAECGREQVIERERQVYRAWLLVRHSPEITAELQRGVYAGLHAARYVHGEMPTDAWARLVATRSAEVQV